MSYKPHFSRFLAANPEMLHFAAHSHHLWPDVTYDAQLRAWDDAARLVDEKWEAILGDVLPACQAGIAGHLGLTDPRQIVFAPNTHDLLVRILSCLPVDRPLRILSTDGEFHSFHRQSRRLVEAGRVVLDLVPTQPFGTFPERILERAAAGGHDLVYVSQVFFDSGFVVPCVAEIVAAVPDPATYVVIDGYHGYMAVPTDLSAIEGRAFYMSGGYKYAMSGEGVCFAHCPPGYAERPVDTGWFAGFGQLEEQRGDAVVYSVDGFRMAGATYDPSGLYRQRAVLDLFAQQGWSVADVHAHVQALQQRFLAGLADLRLAWLPADRLLPDATFVERGHFLTFQLDEAPVVQHRLRELQILTDVRDDRLRFGFGLYQDPSDVDAVLDRMRDCRA